MMRVRTDGQVLGPAQLRALGETSTTYARNTADITDRSNIQYHWIEVENVPAIWDAPRVGRPHHASRRAATRRAPSSARRSPASPRTRSSTAPRRSRRSSAARIGNPEFSNLPRKFKTALTGHPSHDVAPEVNDVSFVGTVHPEHGPGFDLWVGGGLSTNPMLAQKLGVWIPLDEVADAWEGVAGIFRDYGYRRLRSKARLKFLVADWGMEKFREVLENEYLHRRARRQPLPGGRRSPTATTSASTSRRTAASTSAPPRRSGRIDGTTLTALADLVEQYGALGARLTAYQKLVVLGVDADRHRGVRRRAREDRPHRPAAATGGATRWPAPASSSASWRSSTPRSAPGRSSPSWRSASPTSTPPISVNVNGCPNACARTQVADIGLKGQLVLDDDGHQVEGFQVHLGGALGLQATFGRKLRAHKVTSADLDDYVTHVVTALPRRPRRGRVVRDLGGPRRRGRCCAASGRWPRRVGP